MKDVMGDILGQTVRVKKIVGDLLEFARDASRTSAMWT